MRIVVVASCVALSGCTALFDLQRPQRGDAASVDDAPRDADVADADASYDAAVDAGMPDAAVMCPATYTSYPGTTSRYRTVTANAPWLTAAADCADDGMNTHLIVIGTASEENAVDLIVAGDKWLGLSDINTEGTFLWVTAEPTGGYPPATGAPWETAEPDGAGDCILLGAQGWTDESCGLNREYICECDAYANDTTRY